MVNIGINGFGRLGRLLIRVAIQRSKKAGTEAPKLAIVNAPDVAPECMAYLLKTDTFYGPFPGDIVDVGGCLVIEGQRIEVCGEKDTNKIPWAKSRQVDYVIDTTGMNTTCSLASRHLREGVKRVLVTGTTDIPMFIMGVNHACFDTKMKALSVGSPSMNCLAVMLKVLHENFIVQKAMATAIHPLSNSDNILDDASGVQCRNSRSAIYSFSPVASAAKGGHVGRVMPELEGRVGSTAIRVPVACVGAVDLTVEFGREASYQVIKARLNEACETYMKGFMRYSCSDIVSSDLLGDSHSCVIDANAGTELTKCMSKVFAWYDGEMAFAHRLYDMAAYIASREPQKC